MHEPFRKTVEIQDNENQYGKFRMEDDSKLCRKARQESQDPKTWTFIKVSALEMRTHELKNKKRRQIRT